MIISVVGVWFIFWEEDFMLKNIFLVTIRNLWRNKAFSFINITGLAIGMASALLIGLWVQHESSFDRWHAKADRIYELYSRQD